MRLIVGLGIRIILPSFQIRGTWFWFRLMLYMCVRYVIALWPKYFKCLMLMTSGNVEFLFWVLCIARVVSCSETVICVFCSFFIFLSITVVVYMVDYFVV